MADQHVQIEKQGSLWQVTLNRPDKAHALTRAMLNKLHNTFLEAANDPDLRVLTITGAGGRVFCAGADLAEVSFDRDDPEEAIWGEMAASLAAVPALTIAIINGACIGGGMTLALGCDIRLCVPHSVFGYPVLQNGILLGDLDANRLRELIGPGRASLFILGGQRIEALEADRWGLIDRVIEAGALKAATAEIYQIALSADRDHLSALKAQCRGQCS